MSNCECPNPLTLGSTNMVIKVNVYCILLWGPRLTKENRKKTKPKEVASEGVSPCIPVNSARVQQDPRKPNKSPTQAPRKPCEKVSVPWASYALKAKRKEKWIDMASGRTLQKGSHLPSGNKQKTSEIQRKGWSPHNIWLWLKKPVPKWNPGKWKLRPKPACCPSCSILSHNILGQQKRPILYTAAVEAGRQREPESAMATAAQTFSGFPGINRGHPCVVAVTGGNPTRSSRFRG